MTTKTGKLTKKDVVLKLLGRAQGATVEQMQKATGWQPHSVRAVLTGLRKAGQEIVRDRNAKGVTVYKVTKASN